MTYSIGVGGEAYYPKFSCSGLDFLRFPRERPRAANGFGDAPKGRGEEPEARGAPADTRAGIWHILEIGGDEQERSSGLAW